MWLWQECGDYSQADYKPEHEERSPFSAIGMGRHRNPAWREKCLPSLWSIAKMKSTGLMVLGLRIFAQQASATWADKTKVKDVPCTIAFPDRNMFSYCIFNRGHALGKKKDQHGFDRWHNKINFQYFVAEKCVCLEKGWICWLQNSNGIQVLDITRLHCTPKC